VGGLGYYDIGTSRYTLVPIPEMSDWSTSALLVEKDVVWAALVGYPEGETYSGGLIRYDLRSRRARKFPAEEVISRIFRYKDRLLLKSKNGAYQLKDSRLVRYRVEPNVDNRFILVTDTVASVRTPD
jgi:hypothetical protein